MQESREPNIISLSVAKRGHQDKYIHHLATGMRKHTQGNKLKAKKRHLLPQSISGSLPASYFKGTIRAKDAGHAIFKNKLTNQM